MMAKATCLVGLDVHTRQTHAALLDSRTGEINVRRLIGMPEAAVLPYLEHLGGGVLAAYEAGPTGFGLAREANKRGLEVRVVAPGSIPKGAGDRVKTDRRDAVRLVRLLAAGELRFAFVPTVEDEAFRDLIRCIEDLRGDLMRARHRLSKFLLRRGRRYEEKSTWGSTHLRWLKAIGFDDGCSQATFVDYLASVQLLGGRRATLLEVLDAQVPGCSYAPTIARMRCFRGIDTLSAAGLCAEVGSFERFPKPGLLSGFLGIVPSERTSDTKRRQGAITKAGPGHARRLLIEAAHQYRRRPAIGETLARRQQGQDPRIIEIAWRAQRRLYQRWQHLREARRKPAGVVAIAVARELAGFLWEAAVLD
jgi:transposase